MSFLTGSRVYGQPKGNSDIDMVVRLSRVEAAMLSRLADSSINREGENREYGEGGELPDMMTMRFGGLNIICCLTAGAYKAWKDGTKQCLDETPPGGLPRKKAVKIFSKLFRERGVCGR